MKHLLLVCLLVNYSVGFVYEVCSPSSALCFLPNRCCLCGAWDKCNIYILIGDYLNMTCTLSPTSISKGIDSSQLYVSYGEGTNLTADQMFIINSTSLGISKQIIKLEEDLDTYRCQLQENGNIIDTSTINIEYPPRAVENFTCIIYNWDERMVCSWNIGSYVNTYHIDVVLNMKDGFCPNQQKNNCSWEKDDGVDFDRDVLNFSIKVTNKKTNDSKLTENLFLEQYNIVKPNPVEFFEAEPINGTCVLLKWQHSKPSRNLYFTVYWNDSQAETTKTELMVCNLKPVTIYNFTIEVRPGKDIGYPSEQVINQIKTGYDKPYGAPEFRENGYNVDEENCYLSNTRRVTVLWKKLPDDYHNGPLYGYYLETTTSQMEVLEDFHINGSDSQHRSFSVPCNMEVVVTIRSWGILGYSEGISTIKIPKAKYLPVGAIVAIVICSLIFLFLVIAFTCYFVRNKCFKKIKKVFELPEIHLPEIVPNYSTLGENSFGNGDVKDSGHGTAKSEEIANELARYSPVSNTSFIHGFENSAMENQSETSDHEHDDEQLQIDGDSDFVDSRLSQSISQKSFSGDPGMTSSQSITSVDSHMILMDKTDDDEDGYNFGAQSDEYEDEDSVGSYVIKGKSSSQSNNIESPSSSSPEAQSASISSLTTEEKHQHNKGILRDFKINENQSSSSSPQSNNESSSESTKNNQYKKYCSQNTDKSQDKIIPNDTVKKQALAHQQTTNH